MVTGEATTRQLTALVALLLTALMALLRGKDLKLPEAALLTGNSLPTVCASMSRSFRVAKVAKLTLLSLDTTPASAAGSVQFVFAIHGTGVRSLLALLFLSDGCERVWRYVHFR